MVHRLHLAVVHGLLDGGTGRSILHCDGVANLRQVLQEDTDLLGQVGDRILAAVTPLGVVERGPFAHR